MLIQKPKSLSMIACIDMDAYYAQVEARRLGFSDTVPLGVKQWEGLIAVSYSARKFGISRFTNAEDARSLCPNIRLPHVDTYKIDENGKISLSTIDDKFKPHNRAKEKVSLDFYRMESKKLFGVIKKNHNKVEVASIDEVFIDLTDEVTHIYQNGSYEKKWNGVLLGDPEQKLIESDEIEVKLVIASQLIQKTREEIYNLHQYTCSAGVSYNKLLAKLGSGLNKPNQQTIIVPRMMPNCIGECKIGKLRLFGGKVGQAFEKKGVNTVGEALKLSKENLKELFIDEEDVNYVYDRLRGYDNEDVKNAEKLLKGLKTKSILSQKTMGRKPALNMTDLSFCVDLIILDLFVRMNHFYDETSALPQNLTMNYYDNVELSNKSKSMELRMFGTEADLRNVLEKSIKELLISVNHVIFPCFMITFAMRNFKLEKGVYMYNIADYCKKMEQEEKKREEQKKLEETKESVLCDKCSKNIDLNSVREHMDYHLAMEVDKNLNPNKKKYKTESKPKNLINMGKMGKSEEINKKTKNDRKSVEKIAEKNRKIEDFFTKK